MHTIKEAESSDLEAYCALWNACWPLWGIDAKQLRRDDTTLPEPMRARRWLAAVDGQPVGFAEAYRPAGTFHIGKWMVGVGVAAEFRSRGIGSDLFATVDASIRAGEVVHASTRVNETDGVSMRFAEARGFRELHREFESLLNLSDLDETGLERLRAPAAGVRLASLAALDSPSFRRAFHELFEEVRRDVPRPEPPVRLEFDFFEKQVLQDPDLLAEGTWLALDGHRLVGFSGTFRGVREGWVDQWLTGVVREYRGQGWALALKASTLLWAKRAGYTTIRTDNNSLNARMLEINDRLGFKRSAAILTMRTT